MPKLIRNLLFSLTIMENGLWDKPLLSLTLMKPLLIPQCTGTQKENLFIIPKVGSEWKVLKIVLSHHLTHIGKIVPVIQLDVIGWQD